MNESVRLSLLNSVLVRAEERIKQTEESINVHSSIKVDKDDEDGSIANIWITCDGSFHDTDIIVLAEAAGLDCYITLRNGKITIRIF